MTRSSIQRTLLAIAGLALSPLIGQAADLTFDGHIILSDPCAVFVMPSGTSVTPINYGEIVALDIKGNIHTSVDIGKDSGKYRYAISVHGEGTGGSSGIRYVFNAKALYKASLDINPFSLDSKFKMTARLIGQSKIDSSGAIVQGAQDNALLRFYVNVKAANGSIQVTASDFTLECGASPWTNMMNAPVSGTKTAVGRGFGDPWNKYAWSMKDFGVGLLVGTKNAHFNYFAIDGDNDDPIVQACTDDPSLPIPSIYKSLACLELFGPFGLNGVATSYAEIWRFDYSKKDWNRVKDDYWSQGFRIMETHNNKLYVGSDLGAFITGIALGSGPGTNRLQPKWDFPGSRILSSVDGKTFNDVPCVPATGTPGPCNFMNGVPFGSDVNVSFRALASYKGKLYLGTFNYFGAELWAYTDTTGAWDLVKKFGYPIAGVTELRVYNDRLYIGLFGQPGAGPYLYSFDGTNLISEGMPVVHPNYNLGVLKLFVGKNLLFAGNVDLENGFNLLSYNGTDWNTITTDGFFNSNNAYAWSMAEVDGRLFLGTFNQDFFATVPRGCAELWYSDDAVNWQQAALPLNWGIWNYGIRTIVLGTDKQLWLGTASNMIAPGLPDTVLPLSPGAEVWTIKANEVDPKK